MMDRFAVAAVAAVLAIGSVAFGASLISRPTELGAGACPREHSERDAIDTSVPTLLQAQRAWGINGGTPERVRSGPIAAFSTEPEDAPLSVITIDPTTGARCRLVRMSAEHVVRESTTTLDWSPSGDALAIGIERFKPEGQDDSDGQVLIWTPKRLLRVWLGPGQAPGVEWAPDGRSIAVWMPAVGSNVQVSSADGSPDRVIEVQPAADHLKWSPDGSRWIVDERTYFPTRSALGVVDVADGRLTPIDVGIDLLTPEGWLDDGTVLLYGVRADQTVVGHLAMPLADPASYSNLPIPDAGAGPGAVLSPDRRRVAYVTTAADLRIVDLTNPAATPVEIRAGGDVGNSLAWSPDGSQVVFTVDVAAELWIANADGSGPQRLDAGWFPFVDPWQPVPVR